MYEEQQIEMALSKMIESERELQSKLMTKYIQGESISPDDESKLKALKFDIEELQGLI